MARYRLYNGDDDQGRLTEKGVLTREKRGLAYIYTLACSREEYAAQAVRQIIDEVLYGMRGLARALR